MLSEDELYAQNCIGFLAYYQECRKDKLRSKKIFDYVALVSNDPIGNTLLLGERNLSKDMYFEIFVITLVDDLKEGYTSANLAEFIGSLTSGEKNEFYNIVSKLRKWRFDHNFL